MKPVLSPLVASFDIFDTVLTRSVGSPVSGFLLLGNKLKFLGLIDCSAESFARARADAERQAFHNAGGINSEVKIDQIYTELAQLLRMSTSQALELITVEQQLEQFLLHPVMHAKQLVDAARTNSKRIAFISDMYMGRPFIEQLLTEKGLFKE